MTHSSKWPPIYVACLIAAAVLLGLLGSDASVQVPSAHAGALDDEIPNVAGDWAGTWLDSIHYTWAFGDVSCTIVQDGSDFTADGIIDLSVLGLGPMPGTGAGTVTREGGRATLNFTFSAAGVGSGVGTQIGGSGTGSGSVAPYGPFTFQGAATSTTIDGTFDFTDPSGGYGSVHMTKDTPVEPSTWGAVKGRYHESGD
ncbi:MAG: hypothetical protein ABIG03_01430 [Candidatus Eisenbacteria bacterium]